MIRKNCVDIFKPVFSLKRRLIANCSPGRLGNYCKANFLRKSLSSSAHLNARPKLINPLIFTIGFSATSFVGCAIVQYERAKQQSVLSTYWDHFKNRHRVEKGFMYREKIKLWWDSLGEGHKIAAGIIGINLMVFGCWRIPAFQTFMNKWFTCAPYKNSSTLLLSCFSHAAPFHIGANMCVLWSFAPLIHSMLGSEQFVAFYLTGGVTSSFMSYLYKFGTGSFVGSLGASGALLAVLAACCIKNPEARLSILFLPFFSFAAKYALCGMITFDVCGLLFRWQILDHAAHLGGTLFGSWYILYGHKYIWDKRARLIREWHKFRKSLEN